MSQDYAHYEPTRTYAGYIFDCDGTLADSMPLHHDAWTHALRAAGATFNFPYELMCQWGGKSMRSTIDGLNEMFDCDLDIEIIRQAQASYIHDHLPHVQPRKHILTLAHKLAHQGHVSVASGGHRDHVHTTLKAIGASELFNIVITADDVQNSKPSPEIFLLAAERMGVEPCQCLVYEDSPTGIQAAKSAGMDYIFVD